MREPENRNVSYCGYSSPMTGQEVEFEILGLEHLIKVAEKRIAFLRQTHYLAEFMNNSSADSEIAFDGEIQDENS